MSNNEMRPYHLTVELLFKEMNSYIDTLMHAVVGVTGEIIELTSAIENEDKENCLEELGDICFYIQKLFNIYGFKWDFHTTKKQRTQGAMDLLEASGEVLDIVKKSWAYNKSLDEDKLKDAIHHLSDIFILLLNTSEWSLEDVQKANQLKLAKRYPSGVYSDTDAQARADKQEEIVSTLGPMKYKVIENYGIVRANDIVYEFLGETHNNIFVAEQLTGKSFIAVTYCEEGKGSCIPMLKSNIVKA